LLGVFSATLPTKGNLVRIRVLQAGDNICVGGCGSLVTVDHLFLGYNFFGGLWPLVWKWLRIYSFDYGVVKDLFS